MIPLCFAGFVTLAIWLAIKAEQHLDRVEQEEYDNEFWAVVDELRA